MRTVRVFLTRPDRTVRLIATILKDEHQWCHSFSFDRRPLALVGISKTVMKVRSEKIAAVEVCKIFITGRNPVFTSIAQRSA
jgi:hypothetical protein